MSVNEPRLRAALNEVPVLDRASELLWQAGHPSIGTSLENEVAALVEKCLRLEAVLYPASATPPDGGSKPDPVSDHRAVVREEAGERDWQIVNAALQAFAPKERSELWHDANMALARLASATTKAGRAESDLGGDQRSPSGGES